MAVKKVKVSERTLFTRVSRKLAADEIKLRRCEKKSPLFSELGEIYEVDAASDVVLGKHINLGEYARALGLLGPHEQFTK
jgi:hypothetical protein